MKNFVLYFGATILGILMIRASAFLLDYPRNPSSCSRLHAGSPVDSTILTDKLLSGLERMDRVMSPDFLDQCGGSLKQLNSNIVKSVKVAESSIPEAGKGLFATKNIKAGTIVSFYPAHTLGVEYGDESFFVTLSDADRNYFNDCPPHASSYLHATDQPIFKRHSVIADLGAEVSHLPLYLDVNPNREVSPAWVSQFINDGAIMPDNTESGISVYYKESKLKKNCIHIPFGPSPILATIATKKIKKGEELFTSYGCVYWIGVQFPNEEGSRMTEQIQQQINDSAQDLFSAMNLASTRYVNQMQELQSAFGEIS
eukprot:scaffold1561_cov129-Cylindrotheca_fusiformis.AAC.20